jgi:hypothetical protein
MSEYEQDNLEPQEQGQDAADDELREEQEGKGFGEDEGERDESLPA